MRADSIKIEIGRLFDFSPPFEATKISKSTSVLEHVQTQSYEFMETIFDVQIHTFVYIEYDQKTLSTETHSENWVRRMAEEKKIEGRTLATAKDARKYSIRINDRKVSTN